jgi:broad specificity phosphatase PhoE
MTVVFLVRHGEVENPGGIRYGRLPGFGLSARGREQAQAAAEELKGKGARALVSSPLQRAVETAEIIGTALGLEMRIDARFIEAQSFRDGLPRDAWGIGRLLRGAEYESRRQVRARVRAALATLGDRTIVVTHETPIWLALGWYHRKLEPGSITTWEGEG